MAISVDELSKFSLFSEFSQADLEAIKGTITYKTIEETEVLLLAGESSPQLFFVISGWLKAEKISSDGRQQTLRFIGPGEIINELSVFSDALNSVTVVALESAYIFYIARDDIEAMLVKYPGFSRAVIANLAKRIRHLLNEVESLSLYPVEARLARYLLSEADKGVVERQSWKTQTEIAAKLGTVLDVLNRHLHKLVKQGIIEINRGEIRIIDPLRLEDIARG